MSERPPTPYLYAVAAPGLEGVVADELRAMGATEVSPEPGGVRFAYDADLLIRANLALAAATRVILVVHAGVARGFEKLMRAVERVDFTPYFDHTTPLSIVTSTRKSRLFHTGAIEQRIQGVLGVREGAGPPQAVHIRITHDLLEVGLDTSGELLHRRGYRTTSGPAPLRETLAAGILRLLAWDPATPFADVMCGTGTFAIEAAFLALRRPPGAVREFAFERWPSVPRRAVKRVKAQLLTTTLDALPAEIQALDRSSRAVSVARKNVERAHVPVQVERADVNQLERTDGPPGLLFANIPYGRRLVGAGPGLEAMERLSDRFPDWQVALLGPASLAPAPDRWECVAELRNGGVPVALLRRRRQGGDARLPRSPGSTSATPATVR